MAQRRLKSIGRAAAGRPLSGLQPNSEAATLKFGIALDVKLLPAVMLRRKGSDGIDGHAPCLGAKKAVAEISTGAFGNRIDDYQLQHEVDVVPRGISLETLIEKLSTIGNDHP